MTRPSAPPPKHVPFKSNYRENFEVVEERQGRISLYPHTDQVPLLLRALNLEFYGALPDRIARVDKRADGFHKLVLRQAAMFFCTILNRTRTDQLRLVDLPNPDLVFKLSIVQQITETTPRGPIHRFRFYAGADFFPEIRLSGRRLVFADHVLQRFSKRVPNNIGEDLSNFLETFYGYPLISMPCGSGRAFVASHGGSILAFPYREEVPGEYFIATCLTVNEINSLSLELPPCTHNFHYTADHTPPARRHWLPLQRMVEFYHCWERKQRVPPAKPENDKWKWDHKLGLQIRDITVKLGYGPGSSIYFLDRVPGPCIAEVPPGGKEPLIDELEACKLGGLKYDWEAAFARRDAILRGDQH